MPKAKFHLGIEPNQLSVLTAIEAETGAPVGVQIRRAIDSYIQTQTFITATEVQRLLHPEKVKAKKKQESEQRAIRLR